MPKKKGICKTCGNETSRSNYIRCLDCRRKEEHKSIDERYSYRREWGYKKKYGIDEDGFGLLWDVQKGLCGICKNQLELPSRTRGQQRRAAVVDHDHTTGNIRGLLCNSCNKGIGLLDDSHLLLTQALKWIKHD